MVLEALDAKFSKDVPEDVYQKVQALNNRILLNVWPHPYNIGNGAAIKSGLRVARGEWVVMMDADGQHQPEDIARLLEHKDTYDMVVGARSKESETRAHRDLANWVYNKFASYVTRFKVEDLTSGFRLVRLSTARQFIYLLPNTFSYPSTLILHHLVLVAVVKITRKTAPENPGLHSIR